MRRTRRRDAGFSLIEIMIAMGIIAIALFAVLSMTMHTNTTREDLREMEIAKEAAFRKIDEIRSLPWGSPTIIPSVVGSYVSAIRQPELVAGLRYDVNPTLPVTSGGDPWNTLANNPEKRGKLTVRLCGVKTDTTTIPPTTLLADFEVEVRWTGVKGKSHYSTRIMLTKGT